MRLTESYLRSMIKQELRKTLLESPTNPYMVKDPGSGQMRRYNLGDNLLGIIRIATKTFPNLMAAAQQSSPDFMDKFEQNLARIQDSASWSGARVPPKELIIAAIEDSLG